MFYFKSYSIKIYTNTYITFKLFHSNIAKNERPRFYLIVNAILMMQL